MSNMFNNTSSLYLPSLPPFPPLFLPYLNVGMVVGMRVGKLVGVCKRRGWRRVRHRW
jgi:hypothetical protein